MRKYCFRKMYFICENKRVIKPDILSTNAYQNKKLADQILADKDKSVKMWNVNKPPITYSVEGFYLVHESLFEEILEIYSK